MANARILVTGATGTLGQDLLARLSLFANYETLGATRQDLDLTGSPQHISKTLTDLKPDIIINTAAFTQVDAAESDFETALKANRDGPESLARWSHEHHAYLIHISTDYVFDGTKGDFYTPQDIPHPVNRYGESKLAGENAVLQANPTSALVLRTSWLYGAGGKNFVPFILNAMQTQSPIRVADDQWGTPTWTGNLCKMIFETLANRPTGLLHGCAKGSVSRYHQALFLCKCLDMNPDFMTPTPTQDFQFAAVRPRNTSMQSSFEMAMDWQTAIEKFLKTQGLLKSHV